MNLLVEQIKEYAGILTENITPAQVGQYFNKWFASSDLSDDDCVKKLDTLATKDWLHISSMGDSASWSIQPMNYNSKQGNIGDIIYKEVEAKYKDRAKRVFTKYLALLKKKVLEKYPNATISDRRAG